MVVDAGPMALPGMTLPDASASAERLGALVRCHFAYVWRVLRRLGLPAGDADDVAQVVFLTASRRILDILPEAERAFLYKTAIHAAYKHRRTAERRREDPVEPCEAYPEPGPGPDELLDRRRARELLDAIVGAMPPDFRVVFVLYEIEGLTTTEIAELLGVPIGTVASRLRRARADFETRIARLEARRGPRGEHHG
jgi:RNA polymerase sigma-70 factor, ECF subfamily